MAEVAAPPAAPPSDAKDAAAAAVEAAVVNKVQSDFVSYLYATHGPQIDQALSSLEEKTQLKREQLSYVGLGVLSLYLVFGGLAQFICNLIGFGYPAYASVKAIRTEGKDDDTQWLTYWTVFGFFSVLDFFAEGVMAYFPVYFLLKALFLVYLYLPQTNGALVLYKDFVDPTVTKIDAYLASQAKEEKKE